MNYRDKLRSLYEEFQERLSEEGEIFRRGVIMPFCEKHGLDFLSGNGVCAFFDKSLGDFENTPRYQIDSVYLPHGSKLRQSKKFAKEVKDIFETLELELGTDCYFYFFVSDVK